MEVLMEKDLKEIQPALPKKENLTMMNRDDRCRVHQNLTMINRNGRGRVQMSPACRDLPKFWRSFRT